MQIRTKGPIFASKPLKPLTTPQTIHKDSSNSNQQVPRTKREYLQIYKLNQALERKSQRLDADLRIKKLYEERPFVDNSFKLTVPAVKIDKRGSLYVSSFCNNLNKKSTSSMLNSGQPARVYKLASESPLSNLSWKNQSTLDCNNETAKLMIHESSMFESPTASKTAH